MKIERIPIAIAIVFGLATWMVDAVVDYFAFSEGSFWRLLIPGVPAHEIYMRSVILASSMVFGVLVSIIFVKRRQAEEMLRESEERYRSLFQASFEAIVIHEQGKILDVNQSFETMFTCSRSEAMGKSVLEFAPEENHEIVMAKIRDGIEEPYTAVGLRRDGTTFPEELHAKEIIYKGRPVRVAAIRDITERKRMEEAEREQRALAEAFARHRSHAQQHTRSGRSAGAYPHQCGTGGVQR